MKKLFAVFFCVTLLLNSGIVINAYENNDDIIPSMILIKARPDFAFRYDLLNKNKGEASAVYNDYYLSAYKVTNEQYLKFVKETSHKAPSYWNDGMYPEGKGNHPVLNVSYSDAVSYCEWLSEKCDGWNFRLPTEAEWENAAMGDYYNDSSVKYPNGVQPSYNIETNELKTDFNFNGVIASKLFNDYGKDYTVNFIKGDFKGVSETLGECISINENCGVSNWANHGSEATKGYFLQTDLYKKISDEGGYTTPVGFYKPNSLGLYDMAGNSWDLTSTVITAQNGLEKGVECYAVRGGSWYATSRSCTFSYRGEGRKDSPSSTVGFRLAADKAENNIFTDVSDAHWAKDDISYFYKEGIINGYEDGTFRPDNNVSKEEFCKLLCSSFNLDYEKYDKTDFADVKNEHWAYPYIQSCYKYFGISKSSYQQEFYPSKPATREEVCGAIVRLIEYDLSESLKENETLYFNDSQFISKDLLPFVNYAYENGILSGYPDGTFKPQGNITRAEVLTLLKRSIKLNRNKKLSELNPDNQFLNNETMRETYLEFLEEVCVYENEPFYTCEYCIYDIDKDKIEELIVKLGVNEADMKIIICTYKDKKVVKIGEVKGGYSEICGNVDDKGITVYYKNNSIEQIDLININNGKFNVSTVVPMSEVKEYTQLDYTFLLTCYDKNNLNIFKVSKNDDTVYDEERLKVATFVQNGVYDGYFSENELPVITLYSDGTFSFKCNYYTEIKMLNGTYETYKSDYYNEYSFVVNDDVSEYSNAIKPSFKLKCNDITGKIEFLTNEEYTDAFGLTGDTYETFCFYKQD